LLFKGARETTSFSSPLFTTEPTPSFSRGSSVEAGAQGSGYPEKKGRENLQCNELMDDFQYLKMKFLYDVY